MACREPVLVPWRLGLAGRQLRELAEPPDLLAKAREAVGVHVLLEACPVSPKLKVLTIRGSMWQKRQAVRAILERLVPREGCLSLLLPSAGFTALQAPGLWEGLKLLGAQLHVPEPLGERFLALAEGNPEQILSTATRVNTALQEILRTMDACSKHIFQRTPGQHRRRCCKCRSSCCTRRSSRSRRSACCRNVFSRWRGEAASHPAFSRSQLCCARRMRRAKDSLARQELRCGCFCLSASRISWFQTTWQQWRAAAPCAST
ncbi:unnamed protein product [Effrenium voratum]|nr:unnamed protein product [Effrenium voratum]